MSQAHDAFHELLGQLDYSMFIVIASAGGELPFHRAKRFSPGREA